MPKKVRIKCKECGSEDITGYSAVYWDVELQRWVASCKHVDPECGQCGCTELEDVEDE